MTTWYREGTVTLTNGSDIVLGIGSEWVDRVLPGGIFFAPAGTLEVERVVSDVSLKLAQPYTGPSVVGAEYAIAPTQGYVVELAKQVNAVLGTFGELKDAWQDGTLVGKGLALKGVKDTVGDLPTTGNVAGDGWLVDTHVWVWTGSTWHDGGELVTTPELEALRDTAVTAAASAAETREAYEDRVYPGVYSTPPTQKPHSGAVPAPGDRCVILIGIVGYEHVRMGGAWLVPNIDAADLALASGSLRVGHTPDDPAARARNVRNKLSGWVDLFDYIPEEEHQAIFAGTSLYNAHADFVRAATKALQTGKGLKCARGKRLNVSDDLDLRGIQRIEMAPDILMGAEKTLTVGGGAITGIYKLSFAEVTNGTSLIQAAPPTKPVFRVWGLKSSKVHLGSCNFFQIYADVSVPSGGSTAYNDFYLSGVHSLVEVRGAAGESWVNENNIWGGRIQRYHVVGGGYKNNHNKSEGGTFEGKNVSIRFENSSTCQVLGARFEDVSNAPGIYMAPDTYGHKVEQTWSGVGNPRGQFYAPIPRLNLGSGNTIHTVSSESFHNTKVWSIDGNSLILANATASVAASSAVNPQTWENVTRSVIKPSLGGFTAQAERIIAMSDPIPVLLGDVVEFTGDFDGALVRPIVVCLDANQNALREEGSGGKFYDQPSCTLNTATGSYRPGTDITAAALAASPTGAVIRSEVKFIRIGVYSATGGFFRSLSASIWTQPLARGATKSAAEPKDLPRALAGLPTQGFAPRGFTLYDSTDKRWSTVTYEHQTQVWVALSAGATSVTVLEPAAIANGDRFGVLLTDGDTHWSLVSAVSGTTFTIDPIPDGLSVANGARAVFNRWSTSTLVAMVASYAAGTLAAGAAATTTVTVPGAAFGDHVRVSYARDLLGVQLTGAVSAADTVTVRFQNGTGASAALSSSALRVRVEKA